MNDSNLEAAWKLRLESEIEKLASENAALKAEVGQVESVCAQVGHQLTREREISAMLREAMEEHHRIWSENGICLSECSLTCNALSKEKEMRK